MNGHRNQTNARDPSLLTGLAFDEQGVRLQPTHATKGTKRYRYYFRPENAERLALRIAAPHIEAAVIDAVVSILRDPAKLVAMMGDVQAAEAHRRLGAATALADRLEGASVTGRIQVLRNLVSSVVITTDALEIALRAETITGAPPSQQPRDSEALRIAVPVQLKRSGRALKLTVRGRGDEKAMGSDPKLIALLAKAKRWFESLSSGQYPSVLALAREHGLATADVTRVIYLAFLAPDLVEKIVRGEQPVGLTAKQLLAAAPLPLAWTQQRALLGFAR